MDHKFATLEGEWTDSHYLDLVAPKFIDASIPVLKERTANLSHLFDSSYWESLGLDSNLNLLTMDHRHWLFPTEDFMEYAERIASVKPPLLRIFNSPFGYENPGLPARIFERLVSDRTEVVCRIVRHLSPETIILAPLARFISPETTNRFLRYFSENRNLFDASSIDICCDLSNRVITQMGSQISQMRKICPKKTFVFMTVPSSEEPVVNRYGLDPETWLPERHRTASIRLRQIYQFIDQIHVGQTHWLITGTCKDRYHRNLHPDQTSLNAPTYFREDDFSNSWLSRSFCGLLSSQGRVKDDIVNAILSLSHE